MGKNKLKRFAFNEISENVIQRGKDFYTSIKGNWKIDFFKNDNPITVELGCGNGEYTIGLGEVFAERNFIGTDIKGARIFKGSQAALEKNLSNVGFLRTKIEFILEFFTPDEIDEIWITFPDPRLKDRQDKHRLTHPRFLALYRKFLKKEGFIHLKTDSRELFDYTLEVLKSEKVYDLVYTFDLYTSELLEDHRGIQTKYEKIFLAEGKKINYLRFKFLELTNI